MLNLLLNKLGCSYLEHKKKHACQKLNYQNIKSIEEFSIQYAVEEEHVTAYVQHMEEQKACALIRAREKQQQQKYNKAENFRF